MPYETDLDTAFTILLGKAIGIGEVVAPPSPPPVVIPVRVVNIAFDIGADGVTITTGKHITFRLGLNGQVRIQSWSLAGLVGGSPTSSTVVVDVRTGSSVSSLSSICGGDEPELVAQTSLSEQAVTDNWSPVIDDPSWVQARVTSVSGTVQRVLLTLRAVVE
jgi:hypothetical protein